MNVQYLPGGCVTAKPRVRYVDGSWWTNGPDYSWGPGTFHEALVVAGWELIKYGPWPVEGRGA